MPCFAGILEAPPIISLITWVCWPAFKSPCLAPPTLSHPRQPGAVALLAAATIAPCLLNPVCNKPYFGHNQRL